jgi:YkoY family integral membrane protein
MQTFVFSDLLILFFLFFLEAFLSIDNAAVIAVFARKLPKNDQNRALWIGIGTGFILRGFVVVFAAILLHIHWVVILGGSYLLYLSIHHFLQKKKNTLKDVKPYSFRKTVFLIEMADIIFAIDSILSAFAVLLLFYSPQESLHKIWIIYLAGILGMIAMRFCSKKLIDLLEKAPFLENLAYLLVAWVGLKLIIDSFITEKILIDIILFLGLIPLLIGGYLVWKKRDH